MTQHIIDTICQHELSTCLHGLSFPDLSGDGLKRISDAEVDISANSSSASVSYANTFTLSLTVLVPMIDEDDNDVNDLSGTALTINYNPFSTSDTNCSSGGSETYLIGSSTSTTLSGSSVSLIGQIGGAAQECIYDVAFDDLVTDSEKLSNQYRFMPQTKFSSQSASISIATVFSPTLNITVPQFDDNNDGRNDFSGVRFYVYFTPQSGNPPGCTSFESVIYQVRDNGQVTLEGRDAVLVDVPAGQSSSCTYTVHWPPSARGNTLRSSSIGIGVVNSATSLNIDYTSGVSGGKKK